MHVYVAGSFTDTKDEREALHKVVFPRVEKWCKHRGLALYVTDMRFKNSNILPVDVCFDEIDKASIVVGVLGNRFDEPTLVDESSLKKFPWLQEITKDGACSVTEAEIRRATMNSGYDRRPFCQEKGFDFYYSRDNRFLDTEGVVPVQDMKKYIFGSYSKVAGQLLFKKHAEKQKYFNLFKSKIEEASANSNNRIQLYQNFPCAFDTASKSGPKIKKLETFCTAVARDLVGAIRIMYPEPSPPSPSALVDRVLQHQEHFRRQLWSKEAYKEQTAGVLKYATSTPKNEMGVCLVTGENGAGKSAFVSRVVKKVRSSANAPTCLYHMIQASPMSANINHMLFSLVFQLQKIASNLNGETFDPSKLLFTDIPSYDVAKHMFIRSLRLACEASHKKNTHIVLFIDGIESLVEGKGPFMELDWLPDWRPTVIGEEPMHWLSQLRLVLTLRTEAGRTDLMNGHISTMKNRCLGQGRVVKCFALGSLNPEECAQAIEAYGSECSEKTQNELLQHPGMVLPRFIQHAIYVLQQSWSTVNRVAGIPKHHAELCEVLLRDIENLHGPEITRKIAAVIECSYGGMYRNELLEFAKLSVATLLPILFKLGPFLTPHFVPQGSIGLIDNKFSLSCAAVRAAVHRRYFKWAQEKNDEAPVNTLASVSYSELHKRLARFFRRKCFNTQFARENTEDAINKAIMQAQGGDGKVEDVLSMAERESESNIWRRSTRCHQRGLLCLPFHLLRSKSYNYLVDIMTDLHYLAACCTANLTYEVVYLIKESKRILLWGRANQRGWAGLKNFLFAGKKQKKVKIHSVNNEDIQRLREFISFLDNYAHWLAIQPYHIFQCAANMPNQSAAGDAALRLWSDSSDRAACWVQNAVLFTTLSPHLNEPPKAVQSDTVQALIDGGKKTSEHESSQKVTEEDSSSDTEEKAPEKDNEVSPQEEVHAVLKDTNLAKQLKFLDVDANVSEKKLMAGFRRWIRWVNKETAPDPCKKSLIGHSAKINSLSFAPKSDQVAVHSLIASASDDCTVRVWNQDGECINTFTSHDAEVTCCNFCPTDMKTLVSSSMDGTLKYWDVVGSQLKYTFADPFEPSIVNSSAGISIFCWSLDGSQICYGRTNGDVVLVQVTNTGMVFEKQWKAHHGAISCCAIIEDKVLTGSIEDKTFRIWDADNCDELLRKVCEPLQINVSPGNPAMGTSNLTLTNLESSALVVLRDSAAGIKVVYVSLRGESEASSDPTILEENRGDIVTACAVSQNRVVHATMNGDIHVFDRNSGKTVGSGILCGHMTSVTACAFSDDGDTLVSGEDDGHIKLWNPTPLTPLDQKYADVIASSARGYGAMVVGIDSQHLEFAPSLATVLHPSSVSSSILVTRNDGAIELLDAETGQLCTQLRRGTATLRAPAKFAKDCKRVLAVNDGSVLVYPVPPEANPIVARGAKEAAPSLNSVAHTVDMGVQTIGAWALSPDSICMAMSGGVSPPHISSYITNETKHLLRFGVSTVPGSIGWMQDNTGCLLAIFSGHWSMITQLQFSIDGKHLFSVGRAMEILIWDTANVKRVDSRGFSSKSQKKPAPKLNCIAALNSPMHVGTSLESFSISPDEFFFITRHDSKVVVSWDVEEVFNHTPSPNDIKKEVKKRNEGVFSEGEMKAWKKGKIEGITESVVAAHTMKECMKHAPGATIIYGHKGIITDVAWASTNGVFATSSVDGTIRVTRAHDNHHVATLTSKTSRCKINALTFTAEGTAIVSISEDSEIRVWRSPAYRTIPTLDKINGVVGADVAWSSIPVRFSSIDLYPDMIYKIKDLPTCLRSTYSMGGCPRICVGDNGGKVNIFELVDVICRPPPIVTAQYTSRLKQQRICADKFLSVVCPGCHLEFNLSTVPAHAVNVLQKKARGAYNNRNIDREYYTDHRLLTYCPRCKQVLRLNPFDAHLPVSKTKARVQLLKPKRKVSSKTEDESDDRSESDVSGSPEISSFIRKAPSTKLEFTIMAFKPQSTIKSSHTDHKPKARIVRKSFNPLKKSRQMAKSRSVSSMMRQQARSNASLGFLDTGKSEYDDTFVPNGPSMRLTKSRLNKSVVEPSIIEPVKRHLPNVHGSKKFSHFSQDRVVTSFGGGYDFKTYKPL